MTIYDLFDSAVEKIVNKKEIIEKAVEMSFV